MRTLEDFVPQDGPICGVDEAGRGPVIGPIVVAGLMVDDDTPLKQLGVKDSKKLTPSRRLELVDQVKSLGKWEVLTVSAEDIDTLRQSMTMNVMESKLFATVIEKLGPNVAFLDAADTNEELFGRYVAKELASDVKIISRHGADDVYPVVSGASIIAKTTRDAEVERIQDELGTEIGSGYPSDSRTINFLKEWYSEHKEMPPHTRKSWKTVNRIINELSITSLDSFE